MNDFLDMLAAGILAITGIGLLLFVLIMIYIAAAQVIGHWAVLCITMIVAVVWALFRVTFTRP